jgi:prolyl 4-hydroxylase|tara:strand:+ start:856 stop:1479 length:624 start_codon:yes stop_codon:yes gene_type:complete
MQDIDPNDLKEYYFDEITLMGAWYMPEEICDKLLSYFKFNKEYQVQGECKVGTIKAPEIRSDIKLSTDLAISPGNFDGHVGLYKHYLNSILDKYLKKYPHADQQYFFRMNESMNIQYYKPKEGFFKYHFESNGTGVNGWNRNLVFMTYLNDVPDGGTEFKYQKIKTEAKKGLTLIWPAYWTHTHRGMVSELNSKYIVTGWYSFNKGE